MRVRAALMTIALWAGAGSAAALELPGNEPAMACQAQSDLIIVVGGQRTPMRSITAQSRTAARAMGFGGIAQYVVLMGNRALYRITDRQPTFRLTVPGNVQPQGLFTLARFEPRPNGSREVLSGGGFMSYSTGISPERQVPLNVQIAADQRGAGAGSTIYELTPANPMAPGEYAMIVSVPNQQNNAPMMGVGIAGTVYDFGVD
jgi:hypothetical protein